MGKFFFGIKTIILTPFDLNAIWDVARVVGVLCDLCTKWIAKFYF